MPSGGPASSTVLKFPSLEKIYGGSWPALDKSNSFLFLSYTPTIIVTNIPLVVVSQISSFKIFKRLEEEKLFYLNIYKDSMPLTLAMMI